MRNNKHDDLADCAAYSIEVIRQSRLKIHKAALRAHLLFISMAASIAVVVMSIDERSMALNAIAFVMGFIVVQELTAFVVELLNYKARNEY